MRWLRRLKRLLIGWPCYIIVYDELDEDSGDEIESYYGYFSSKSEARHMWRRELGVLVPRHPFGDRVEHRIDHGPVSPRSPKISGTPPSTGRIASPCAAQLGTPDAGPSGAVRRSRLASARARNRRT